MPPRFHLYWPNTQLFRSTPECKFHEDVAFVIFNVKGCDLLAIDEPNEFDSDTERKETFAIYRELGMTTRPFQNDDHPLYYQTSRSDRWTFLQYAQTFANFEPLFLCRRCFQLLRIYELL